MHYPLIFKTKVNEFSVFNDTGWRFSCSERKQMLNDEDARDVPQLPFQGGTRIRVY